MVFVESLATNLDNLRTVYLLNQDGSQRTRILGLQTRRVSFRLVLIFTSTVRALRPAYYRHPPFTAFLSPFYGTVLTCSFVFCLWENIH